MKEGYVVVENSLGLHARAAAKLVKTANRFESRIVLRDESGRVTVNAKSILSVLTLAAAKGKRLQLRVSGNDEDGAFQSVTELFLSGFGEA